MALVRQVIVDTCTMMPKRRFDSFRRSIFHAFRWWRTPQQQYSGMLINKYSIPWAMTWDERPVEERNLVRVVRFFSPCCWPRREVLLLSNARRWLWSNRKGSNDGNENSVALVAPQRNGSVVHAGEMRNQGCGPDSQPEQNENEVYEWNHEPT